MLLHGFTQTCESFERSILAAPKDGRAIWAFALPGHHPAVPVVRGFSANVEALAARIANEVGEGINLIGYSLGGRCALGLIACAPRLAKSVTLIGAHSGLRSEEEREARRDSDARWVGILRSGRMSQFVSAWEAQPLFSTQARVPPEFLDVQRRRRLAHDPSQLADSIEELGLASMPDYGAVLRNSEAAITLVTGALDAKFTALAAKVGLPHRVVANVGHNIVLEEPAAIWR